MIRTETPLDWPDMITHYGKAAIVAGALLGGAYTVVSRTVETVKAGPEAKAQAADLNVRVTKLEKESHFVVHGIEKLTHSKYNPEGDGE